MSYQAIVSDEEGRVWDSIRDTDRQALHKVADYMKRDSDSFVVAIGHVIQDKLVFGHSVETINDALVNSKFTLTIKYIP